MAQDHIWAPLAEGQPTHHREPGQMIYLQDTEAAQFYYILTGTVKCFISSPDGDERTLALHHGGELIGEASFFDRQPRVSSAVAVTPCELISVNRQHLEAVFARRPDLAISMLEYLARTVRLLSGHVDSAFLQADKHLQDTEAAQFYYILTGTVKCFISSPDGDERTLALHHGGELIGEASFFDRQPRVSSAVAVTPCELISVNRQHLEAVFARRPDLAISMLEYLARTVRLLSGHVDSAFLQADKRIARHLLALEPDARGLLHCTHEEIGSSVGVSRVTVSRVLGDFDRRGWVETGYKSLKLCNRQAIADFLTEGVG